MTNHTRVLFVDQFGTIGGGQRVLLSLLRVAVREFSEVGILAPAGPLEEAVRAQCGGRVTYYRCEEPKLTHGRKRLSDIFVLCGYAWRFRKHFKLLKAQQIIYVNGLRHLPHMLVFCLLLQARIIYHVHLSHSGLERLLIRLAGRWPGTFRVVANSAYVGQQLHARNGCIIRNALDPSFARQSFVNRFGSSEWQLAVVGTLQPEKGQDTAMNAVAGRPGMTLHLIGHDGPGAELWIAALKERRVPNVVFEGETDDVIRRIDELKIQISLVPSRWPEAFGLVAIESMACSCLTIISGNAGLAEIAADTGALVAKDRDELGAALDRLRALPTDALAQLARQQFEATQRVYAPEGFERQIRDLLRAALSADVAGP